MSVRAERNVQRVARTMRNDARLRVTRTPRTITTPPRTWPIRIGSERISPARTTARAGTRNWNAAVRVGPMTLTPFWTTTFDTPAARNPEYNTAPTTSGGI